ncbi:MAG: hypothetical protein QG671_3493 [Actinomycetota bacterium]|nr:hypothetical protein [Actinomycetota bacterium]
MPTLTTYRQAAAKLIGPYRSGTATSGSNTTVLEDTSWPVKSSLSQDDLFVDKFLYRPSATDADKTRVVATYTPASGYLYPDNGWSVAPYAGGVGESYEIHGLIEPGVLHECINEALKRIPLVIEVTLTPASNLYTRQSLATYSAWLTEEWQVRKVGVLPQGSTDREQYKPVPRRGRVVRDGSTLYLEAGSFETTDTVYLTCVKAAYYHCKPSAGTWGDQSGLALNTDQAMPVAEWVAYGTLCEVWLRYGQLLDQTANQRMIRDQAAAAAMFTSYAEQCFRLPEIELTPIRAWGPRG